MMPTALTIAGSDPSGGAGIQADLKTFHQHQVFGTSVVTLLTVQNTQRVSAVSICDPQLVLQQLEAVVEDIPPQAAKTGALGNSAVIEAVGARAAAFQFPLVVDPVMISKHGAGLLHKDAVDALVRHLLPHAFLITPNLAEAAALARCPVEDRPSMEAAAKAIAQLGPRSVLIKGGHLTGVAVDILWSDGAFTEFPAGRIDTRHTHGTGCVFSAAITSRLALGESLVTAVGRAKDFITRAIRTSPQLGQGYGPVNMHEEP